MAPVATSRSAKVTLPSDTEILITRVFDAPAASVYRVYTTPELVRRWWHAGRGVMTACEIDLRVGGSWRYAMLAHGEFEVAFHGEYREIVENERLVCTEVYEGVPDAEALGTITFTEHEGRTTLAILVQHGNQVGRDAQIASGMEDGLQNALDLLELAAIALTA